MSENACSKFFVAATLAFVAPSTTMACPKDAHGRDCIGNMQNSRPPNTASIYDTTWRNICDVDIEVHFSRKGQKFSQDQYVNCRGTKNNPANKPCFNQCTDPSYCGKEAKTLYVVCPGTSQETREKPPSTDDAPAPSAKRLDERECQAKAIACQDTCRKTHVNDDQAYINCQGSDDVNGCMTRFNACKQDGQWNDPDVPEGSADKVENITPRGNFDGYWEMMLRPIKNCELKAPGALPQLFEIKNNKREKGLVDWIYYKSVEFSISAAGDFRMTEHSASVYTPGVVVFSGKINGNSGQGTYRNTVPPHCHGTFTIRRK